MIYYANSMLSFTRFIKIPVIINDPSGAILGRAYSWVYDDDG